MKYLIKEYKPAYYVWTYEVEAENENQAYNAVFDGAVEPLSTQTIIEEDVETQYEIDEI